MFDLVMKYFDRKLQELKPTLTSHGNGLKT